MRETALQVESDGAIRRFLTFRMAERLYALPAEAVRGVIPTPPVARVPQGHRGLLGLANLRGEVAPIASLRGLLGREAAAETAASRAILLEGRTPLGLAVDSVGALVDVAETAIEPGGVALDSEAGERIAGAFRAGADELARILDLRGLLEASFAPRDRAVRAPAIAADRAAPGPAPGAETRGRLVTFEVADQEFALPMEQVHEIVAAPASLTASPGSEALVLGMTAYREGLLPVLSLRGLLSFEAATAGASRRKIVVTRVANALVGLAVDRMRAILPADPDLMEPAPRVLAARAGGETPITAIYRGEGGRRLVSILDVEHLFGRDVMARLDSTRGTEAQASEAARSEAEALFLVFRLAGDAFGLPIAAVEEVARVPDQITHLPRTPAFLEGVVNLRGEILPVIDQRRRFDMAPSAAGEGRRLIVVRAGGHRAGLIVDGVSEVLRSPAGALAPAPELTGDAARLVQGVINLEAAGRLILVLDPGELLSRSERGLLDAFRREKGTPEG